MVSTITTSTITTVAIAGSLAIIGILILLALLIQKEIVTSASGNRYSKLGQALNIGIIPLLIAFVLLVIVKVSDVLH